MFPRFHFRPVGVRSAPTNDKISSRLGMVVSPYIKAVPGLSGAAFEFTGKAVILDGK